MMDVRAAHPAQVKPPGEQKHHCQEGDGDDGGKEVVHTPIVMGGVLVLQRKGSGREVGLIALSGAGD